jgi:hypothetical protein
MDAMLSLQIHDGADRSGDAGQSPAAGDSRDPNGFVQATRTESITWTIHNIDSPVVADPGESIGSSSEQEGEDLEESEEDSETEYSDEGDSDEHDSDEDDSDEHDSDEDDSDEHDSDEDDSDEHDSDESFSNAD